MVIGIIYQGKQIPCRLIIFDKDGTLVDFSATWIPLILKRADSVMKAFGKNRDVKSLLLGAWGIDPLTHKVDPRGPCPVAPRSDEIVVGTMVLYQQGCPWDESKQLVARAFDDADADTDRRTLLKPVEGIQTFLHHLKAQGFSLAIATSDERRDTEAVLSVLGLEGLFDRVLCDGEYHPPKPHPEAILTICRELSIPPGEAAFIGDTVTDMVMGKRAAVALTIGIVEGGVTPREELAPVADVVFDSLREMRFFAGP
jgi:phosphoglycolate phosphatase